MWDHVIHSCREYIDRPLGVSVRTLQLAVQVVQVVEIKTLQEEVRLNHRNQTLD
jgi:hypothetical protein